MLMMIRFPDCKLYLASSSSSSASQFYSFRRIEQRPLRTLVHELLCHKGKEKITQLVHFRPPENETYDSPHRPFPNSRLRPSISISHISLNKDLATTHHIPNQPSKPPPTSPTPTTQMTTTFNCYHTFPPAPLPPALTSSGTRPPTSLPHRCRACMAYSARGQEARVRCEFRQFIEAETRRIAEFARDQSRNGRMQFEQALARREELRWEERETVDECWDNFESIWGSRPL